MQMATTRMLSGQSSQAKSTIASFAVRLTVEVTAALFANIAENQDLIRTLTVGKSLGNQETKKIKGIEVLVLSERAKAVEGD